MDNFDKRPPPLPPQLRPLQNELQQFQAKWIWIGWQILKWAPDAFLTIGIFGLAGPVASAAFLALLAAFTWAYSAGRMADLVFWIAFAVLAVVISVFGFQILSSSFAPKYFPEFLGSLLLPMLLTLGGRRNPRIIKVVIILSMMAFSISLYQIENSIEERPRMKANNIAR